MVHAAEKSASLFDSSEKGEARVPTTATGGSPCAAVETPVALPACGGPLRLTVQPHHRVASMQGPTTIMGMASLAVPAGGAEAILPRLDLVAVVDRSGSMSGQRLHLVKSAVSFMCRHLRPSDRLALVSYSDQASVDLPLCPMDAEGQAQCQDALNALQASGQTNLHEGLLWGLGELACSEAPAAALLLFTDGLANVGLTSTEALVEAMQGPMADMGRRSRAVFTLGFGEQHNAQMLFSIADAGTGCYSFVSMPAAIGPCFADILGGMLSIAAQDVTLTLQATSGSTIREVHADFPVEMSGDATRASIRMRDLQGDTDKDVLFSMELPVVAAPEERWRGLECTVCYIDAASGMMYAAEASLIISRIASTASHEQPHDVVESHRCRLVAAAAMETAAQVASSEAGLAAAHAALSDAFESLETSPALAATDSQASGRVRDLIADLRFCVEQSKDAATCVKWCSSKAFAHKHQTSASAEHSAYRNPLQLRLLEAAQREINQTMPLSSLASRGCRRGGRRAESAASNQPMATIGQNSQAWTDSIQAGAMRIGMRVLCQGHPGILKDVHTSKTGKHGHAKVFFTVECDDGKRRQDITPASHAVALAP